MIVFLHIPNTAASTFQFILENSFGLSAGHTYTTNRFLRHGLCHSYKLLIHPQFGKLRRRP